GHQHSLTKGPSGRQFPASSAPLRCPLRGPPGWKAEGAAPPGTAPSTLVLRPSTFDLRPSTAYSSSSTPASASTGSGAGTASSGGGGGGSNPAGGSISISAYR